MGKDQQNSNQKGGYANYLKSLTANYQFWHSVLVDQSEQALYEQLDAFHLVCRAVRMGLNFEETFVPAAKFTASIFPFAEQSGNYAEWCLLLTQVIEITNLSDEVLYQLYSHLGQLYIQRGQYESALNAFESALESAEKLTTAHQVAILVNITGCYIEQREFVLAEQILGHAEKQSDSNCIEKRVEVAAKLHSARIFYHLHQDILAAEAHLVEALKLSDNTIPASMRAYIYRTLAELYLSTSDFTIASKYLQLAEKLLIQSQSIRETTHLRLMLGNMYFFQQNWTEAKRLYQDIPLEQLERFAYIDLCALTKNNLGNVFGKMQCWQLAEGHLIDCLKLWKKIGNDTSYANSLGSLGQVYIHQKQYQKGRKMVQEAVTLLYKMSPTDKIKRWIDEFESTLKE